MSEIILNDDLSKTISRLSKKERGICESLIRFNQLRAFKLEIVEVLGWKDTLLEIKPDLDVDVLKMAINGLVSGEIPYDQHIGIKNIFIAIKRVARDDDGKLYLLKPVY